MKRILVLFLIASLPLAFSGCGKKTAATVEGEKITEEMLEFAVDEKLAEHSARGAQVNRENIKFAVLEDVIAQKLMARAARQKGLSVTAEDVSRELAHYNARIGEAELRSMLSARRLGMDYMSRITEERMLGGMFYDQIVPATAVTEQEVKDYYKNMQTPMLRPEQVEVRFVQFDKKEDALSVLKQIKESGGNFDKVVDSLKMEGVVVSQYSWVQTGQFSPGISKALSELKTGSYGGPYEGKENQFIFRVKARAPQRPETFDESKEKILGILLDQKRQAAINEWIKDQKTIAQIDVDEKYAFPPGHPSVKQ